MCLILLTTAQGPPEDLSQFSRQRMTRLTSSARAAPVSTGTNGLFPKVAVVPNFSNEIKTKGNFFYHR